MNIVEESLNDNTENCQFCNERKRMYTCPRCGMGYCNLECYKSEAHIDCSESFYKQCVEEELKSQEADPEARQRMIEILKRVHEEEMNEDIPDLNDDIDNEELELDSDDEENIPDLETRLQNIDLNNADEIWSALTETEKQEFDALIKNGEAEKLLPQWVPWWSYGKRKKLIEELKNDGDVESYMKHCPDIIDIPICAAVEKASSTVKYNLMNVINAYAYIAVYYNGDYLSCPEEAAIDFLSICENMRSNKIYQDSVSPLESVLQNINNCNWLPQDDGTSLAIKEVSDSIIQGPEEVQTCLYICAALSELHRLFTASINNLYKQKGKSHSKEFSKKFSKRTNAGKIDLSKKSLFLHCKKLEYYISWAKTHNINT